MRVAFCCRERAGQTSAFVSLLTLVPGQPACHYPRLRIGGAVAARKQKKQRRMSAQVVEDEDYQLRYEVVAGIDVAKESAVVCVRVPPAAGRKHRTSHLQTVAATVPAIGELAAELKAAGVQMVSMEATSDYWRVWVRHEVALSE